MTFVLDASVALAWVLSDEEPSIVDYARAVLVALRGAEASAVVPDVWQAEVAGVLLRRLRAGALSTQTFDEALQLFDFLKLESRRQAYTLRAIAELALRYRLQAIDALYLDLALQLELPIATVDRGLRSAAKAHGVALVTPAPGA